MARKPTRKIPTGTDDARKTVLLNKYRAVLQRKDLDAFMKQWLKPQQIRTLKAYMEPGCSLERAAYNSGLSTLGQGRDIINEALDDLYITHLLLGLEEMRGLGAKANYMVGIILGDVDDSEA